MSFWAFVLLFIPSFASFFHLSAAFSTAVFRQYFRVFFGNKPEVSIFQARWQFWKGTLAQRNVPALLIHVLVATIFERARARDHRRWATQMARRHEAMRLSLDFFGKACGFESELHVGTLSTLVSSRIVRHCKLRIDIAAKRWPAERSLRINSIPEWSASSQWDFSHWEASVKINAVKITAKYQKNFRRSSCIPVRPEFDWQIFLDLYLVIHFCI